MNPLKATLVSVFSSIQGEGLYAGQPHLFIRLAGCNLRCAYCDTPESRTGPEYGRIETAPFSKTSHKYRNPVESGYLLHTIKRLNTLFPHYRAIALTGGEPLQQSAFLAQLLPGLRRFKIPILLETNGTQPEKLREIIRLVDIVSMDVKMPPDCGPDDFWAATSAFLATARRHKKKSYAKIVLTGRTAPNDCRKAARLLRTADKHIPVILQPATALKNGVQAPDKKQLMNACNIFTSQCRNVRIIPQIHRMMGWA
jgi:organic radical activating enzyme